MVFVTRFWMEYIIGIMVMDGNIEKSLQNRFYIFYRIISLIALVILCVSETRVCYFAINERFLRPERLYVLVVDSVGIIICVMILIKPRFFILTSILAFIYSVFIIYGEPINKMGLFMFYLAIAILWSNGFFKKERPLRIIFCVFLFLIENFLPLKHGTDVLFECIIDNVGYTFVVSLIIIFIILGAERKEIIRIITKKQHIQNGIGDNKYNENVSINDTNKNESSELNLAEYEGTKRTDVELLKYIQEGKSHSEISALIHWSEGTVRNRASTIFKTLGVHGKTQFLNKYGKVDVLFDESKLNTT